MFKANLVMAEAQGRILDSGVAFGQFEKSIAFELRVERNQTPLSLSLLVRRVPGKTGELLIGKLAENRLEVQFLLAPHVQMAWLDSPTGILEVEGFIFELMFAVEPLGGSDMFLLSYELRERRK